MVNDDCPITLQKALDDERRLRLEAERMLKGCEARYFAISDKLKAVKRKLSQRLTRAGFYELKKELDL